ncbi:MAG: fibronectin type III domain-containing protein [Acidobacteria bacterium]|nr:fibronectin type III domain-containing protein [Acidobacteriota bacterium]
MRPRETPFDAHVVVFRVLHTSRDPEHSLPDAPVLVLPVEGGSVFFDDAVIQWMAVADPPGGRIIGYQVIVETDDDGMSFTVDLGRDARRVRVPPEFMDPGTEYKFEVLAIERNGNRTASEREFKTQN